MPTVVAQPYSTAGNGGRKLVRLSNGWLIACVINNNTDVYVYKSTDNGGNWVQLTYISGPASFVASVSIVADNNDIKLLVSYSNNLRLYRINATDGTSQYATISSDNTAPMNSVSLAIDPTNGHLHAAWASKHAAYPNSFNIRYAKSTDGGATWSAVEQVTTANASGMDNKNPSIVVRNGIPVIMYEAIMSGQLRINAVQKVTSWTVYVVYNGGTYTQFSPSAVVDKDGVIHVAWMGVDSVSVSTYEIYYSRSIDGGITWSSPTKLTNERKNQQWPTITTDKTGRLDVVWQGLNSSSVIDLRSKTYINGAWSTINTLATNTSASNPSTLYDATFTGQFGDAPPTIYQSRGTSVEYIGTYTINSAPVINVTSPTANQTLHENDVFNITGTTSDADAGNSVTVRYQLNAEPARAIKAFISTGATESFSKSLTFKAGKLFDGETAVTGVLADGVAHKLTVYATDDQGGTSPIVERTFYAVPNRAPALTVDAVIPSGIINTDAFDISGSYSDPDGNTTTVRYKINGSNPVEIAQGTSGAWSFTLPLGKLVVGENIIVIEAEDTYGAKTSKTVKLRKNEVKTSIKTGVARYKIEPPTGTAQEVMLWIQHDANLTLDTSISMTQAAEAETYVPMSLTNTASLSNGQVESEFYYNASEAKENIIVQITQTKTAADANEKITLISGVL